MTKIIESIKVYHGGKFATFETVQEAEKFADDVGGYVLTFESEIDDTVRIIVRGSGEVGYLIQDENDGIYTYSWEMEYETRTTHATTGQTSIGTDFITSDSFETLKEALVDYMIAIVGDEEEFDEGYDEDRNSYKREIENNSSFTGI